MNRQAYGAALDNAVAKIAKKLGVDVSKEALPKTRSHDDYVLFALQAIAEYEPEPIEIELDVDSLIAEIESIDGIGAATVSKIKAHFKG